MAIADRVFESAHQGVKVTESEQSEALPRGADLPSTSSTWLPSKLARFQCLHDFFELENTKARGARSRAVCNGVPQLRRTQFTKLRMFRLSPSSVTQSVAPERPHAKAGPKPANGIRQAPREFIRRPMSSSEMRDTNPGVRLRRVLLLMSWFFGAAVCGHGWLRRSWRERGTVPEQNRQWRAEHRAANGARDANSDEYLEAGGWTSLPFWDHEDPNLVADLVTTELVLFGPPMPSHSGVLDGEMGFADSNSWGRSFVSCCWDRCIPNSSAGVQ